MRARLALAASGCRVILREVLLRDKPKELLTCSPKATVPVLVLGDGTVIDESLDVMYWAFGKCDPDGWLPKFGSEEAEETASLIQQNDDVFKVHLDRYKYPNRHPAGVGNASRAGGLGILRQLDLRLRTPFLIGDTPTVADIAIFPFVRQFAHVDRDWFYAQEIPALQAWLTHWLESGLFASVMQKYGQWHPEDCKMVIFP